MFGFRARLSVWSELELGVTLLTFQSEIVFNLADFSRFFFVVSRFQIEFFFVSVVVGNGTQGMSQSKTWKEGNLGLTAS